MSLIQRIGSLRSRRGLALAALLLTAVAPVVAATHAAGAGGAIASAEPAATEVGIAALRAGGNAVDAAVAVALALAVVHPQAGNLGGGGFALIRRGGKVFALDFRETAPAAARPDMFLGPDGKPASDASWVGPLSSGVPGSPAGLFELHRRFGTLAWSRIVEPAIHLARDGFSVTPRLHDAIAEERELLSRFPETAATWLPGGEPPAPGMLLTLPDLARTLAAYAERGPTAITSGPIALATVSASKAHGGILTEADLAGYRPAWREPLRFRAFGWEVGGMPLPSSGGTILAETCALLERLAWQRLPSRSADRDHLLIEAWRRAYADRFVLGDPSTTEATPERLLSPSWIAERSSGIDRGRATPSLAVRPWPGTRAAASPREAREAAQTTHLSVVDGSGDLVSLTTTLNGWFGCGLQVTGAGFLLNNEMDDFTTAPGLPNAYGLVQGNANAVRPGMRMLSSMSPTIAWKGGETLALGSPGGSRIPTATTQVLLALAVDGAPLREAVERPRFHHQWLPDEVVIEQGALPSDVRADLERRGHAIKITSWRVGEVDAVRRRPDGSVEAAADPRGPGGAAVARERRENPAGAGSPRTVIRTAASP